MSTPYEPPLILNPAGLVAGCLLLTGCIGALGFRRAFGPRDGWLPLRGRWMERLLRGGIVLGAGLALVSAPDLVCPAVVLAAAAVVGLAIVSLLVLGACLLAGMLLRGVVECVSPLVRREGSPAEEGGRSACLD